MGQWNAPLSVRLGSEAPSPHSLGGALRGSPLFALNLRLITRSPGQGNIDSNPERQWTVIERCQRADVALLVQSTEGENLTQTR
jgi:hypothetical protein